MTHLVQSRRWYKAFDEFSANAADVKLSGQWRPMISGLLNTGESVDDKQTKINLNRHLMTNLSRIPDEDRTATLNRQINLLAPLALEDVPGAAEDLAQLQQALPQLDEARTGAQV